MLFSCGVATGLFYYSVAEPMWHYRGWGGARWMDYMNDNDKAIHALMVTWFHWGIHGWIPYTVVGALIGIMSYRRDSTLWNHYYDLMIIAAATAAVAAVAAAATTTTALPCLSSTAASYPRYPATQRHTHTVRASHNLDT